MRSENSGPNGSERSERSERSQRERSEKSESPYRTRTSDRELGPDRPSDLLIATFGGSIAHWTNGQKSGGQGFGPEGDWRSWPSHTAAEMGPPSWNAVDQPARVQVRRQRAAR